MSKKKVKTEKKPTPAATGIDLDINVDDTTSNTNSTTEVLINQEKMNDFSESQMFKCDENDYQAPIDTQSKGTHWIFIVYPESAPADWMTQLEATGLPFTVSPLHDRDKNPDGSPKKAHYHVIVSFGQAQRYSAVIGLRLITHGPYPLKCGSVSGTYAYFTHRNNPEKAQYDKTEIKRFNGWEKQLEAHEVSAIKRELTLMCLLDDIQEYSELIIEAMDMDGDYETVAMSNTVYFDRLISSYRHAPLRTLMRFLGKLEDDEERKSVKARIDYLLQYVERN